MLTYLYQEAHKYLHAHLGCDRFRRDHSKANPRVYTNLLVLPQKACRKTIDMTYIGTLETPFPVARVLLLLDRALLHAHRYAGQSVPRTQEGM